MLLMRSANFSALCPVLEKGSVATIGNFDGLHLGHQAIFERLKEKAKNLNLPGVVITFEPLPREYFIKKQDLISPPRLTRFQDKVIFLKNLGIDVLICLHFNEKLAQLSAPQFVENILIKQCAVKHLIIGEDFHFGRNREGDLAFLQSKQNYFTVETAPVFCFEKQRISSTWVRQALQENNLVLAEELLGRPYSISGKVIHGDKRARAWGVPTANLNVHRSIIPTVLPVKGVYTVQIKKDGCIFNAVANVGMRPTINGFRNLLEVHLLDFNESLYDQTIEVQFIHKIRDEKRFDSLELLKQQILKDVETARDYFLNLCREKTTKQLHQL